MSFLSSQIQTIYEWLDLFYLPFYLKVTPVIGSANLTNELLTSSKKISPKKKKKSTQKISPH